MNRINKKVIVDFFRSFFKQYRITYEQFTKIRSLTDEAECGCCHTTTIYWVDDSSSNATPASYQLIFKDVDDNIITETSVTGTSPQRVCVPTEATQVCLNIISAVSGGGTYTFAGSNGFFVGGSESVSETCFTAGSPLSDVYIVATQPD